MNNADQRTGNSTTRCLLRAYTAAKCDCGRDSAPDAGGGELTALPRLQRRGGKGREGRKKRKEAGRERKGRGREFDSDAELEQGLRLAKAGVGPDRLLFAV